jgi:hypothetical protein
VQFTSRSAALSTPIALADASPQTQISKGQAAAKPSPMRKVASSDTLRPTSAPDFGPKRSSSQPPRNPKILGPSPFPANTAQKGPNSHWSTRGGSVLQGKLAPKISSSAALAPGGSASEGGEQLAKSAALAEGFLASLQAGGLVKERDGNDLLFTFSDDSDDEASAGESLQSEMDKVRQQMQRLEEGRRSREMSAPLEENGARGLDAARPPSGKGLSRLAGRLGPLKGVPSGGVPRVVVADPVIASKTASVESALEEMRRRVELMEREMKQGGRGGAKVERKASPSIRKTGKPEEGARKGTQKGGSALQEGYRMVTQLEKKEGAARQLGAPAIAPVGVAGTKKEPSAGREMRDGGLQQTQNRVSQPGVTAGREMETGANVVEAVQQGASVQGRNGPGGERATTRSGKEGRVAPQLKVEPMEIGIEGIEEKGTSTQQRVPAREGAAKVGFLEAVQEGIVREKAVEMEGKRGGDPAPKSPERLGVEGKASPGKRKAALARIASPAKLQKLEGRSAKDGASVSISDVKAAAVAHAAETVDHKQESGNPSQSGHDSRMLTSAKPAGGAAGTSLGEAGALVPAEVGLMMADLGVTSADLGVMSADLGVTSAERQLALLAREDEQCRESLRTSEKAAADASKRRDELQRELSEVERTERETRRRVLLMQQKLEGNRRLRVELELRDRMERRLREVIVKPGGFGASGSAKNEAVSGVAVSGGAPKRAIAGVIEMEGGNEGGSGREESVLAGGNGAVWTHEAHKGGYVVSQLEEVEGSVRRSDRDLHQTAEVRVLEMAQGEGSKTEGEPVPEGGKFEVEELAFEMGGEKSTSAPGEIRAVDSSSEMARRSGGAQSKGVASRQDLEAGPKTQRTWVFAELTGGAESQVKGWLEAAAPSSRPGSRGGVEKQGQDGLGVDPLASAQQQVKSAVLDSAEQQLDQTARVHADLQLDKASQVGKQAPTRKRSAETVAGGAHERKGVSGQAPEVQQKRARVVGVTGGSGVSKTALAGVTGGGNVEEARLAGVTGGSKVGEARLAGVTGGSKVGEARLAGVTGGSGKEGARLAGVTGGSDVEEASLAGVTGGGKVGEVRLAGVTGGGKVGEVRLAGVTGGGKVEEVSGTEGKVVGGSQDEEQEAHRKDAVSRLDIRGPPIVSGFWCSLFDPNDHSLFVSSLVFDKSWTWCVND